MDFIRNPLGGGIWICLATMALASQANADCLSRCLGGCEFPRPDDRYCQDVRTKCAYQVCPGKGSHDYGAIAYSPSTGATGWSNKNDTRTEAENAALAECLTEATDCAIEVWFDDTCGALAVGDNGTSFGLGETARSAQLAALNECRKGGGRNCEVKESVCSRGAAD